MIDMKWIKRLGLAATLVGMGTTLITEWVAEKKTEQTIKEEVNKALAERETESES